MTHADLAVRRASAVRTRADLAVRRASAVRLRADWRTALEVVELAKLYSPVGRQVAYLTGYADAVSSLSLRACILTAFGR